jgi:hypothetical protein
MRPTRNRYFDNMGNCPGSKFAVSEGSVQRAAIENRFDVLVELLVQRPHLDREMVPQMNFHHWTYQGTLQASDICGRRLLGERLPGAETNTMLLLVLAVTSLVKPSPTPAPTDTL